MGQDSCTAFLYSTFDTVERNLVRELLWHAEAQVPTDDENPTVAIDPLAQVVRGAAGEIWILRPGRNFKLRGLEPDLLKSVLSLADGNRDVASIRSELAGRFDSSRVAGLLAALRGVLWHPKDNDAQLAPAPVGRVVLIGNGVIFQHLCSAMRRAGIAQSLFVLPESFESCLAPAFVGAERLNVLREPDRAVAPPNLENDVDIRVSISVPDLAALFTDAALVVCALEGIAVRGLLDVEDACARVGRPCLYVTARSPHDVMVGPIYVPGAGAHLPEWLKERIAPHCDASLLPHIRLPTLSSHPVLLETVCAETIGEMQTVLDRRLSARVITLVSLSLAGRSVEPVPALRARKSLDSRVEVPCDVEDLALSQVVRATGRGWVAQVEAARPPSNPDAYCSVGIVGGGTAGYLTALALRARLPELDVTLIESSKIPVIGVGEATTPELVRFLHGSRFLSLDLADFYRRVTPTWKLGIKFEWGLPGDYFFTFPFQRGRLLESHLYRGHLNHQSLGALLMSDNRVPVFALAGDEYESHLSQVRFAYHLENRRFVRYLREEALRFGVKHLDCVVADAKISPGGGEIDCLITEDGRELKFDLYVDCSGFRSLLLEGKLGSRFLSYQQTLMTDCAIAAGVPHDGVVKPYTLAETMDNGWCWNIPFEDEDHRGYVFSSAFTSVDQAMDEMRRKNPEMHDPFVVKFRSGRHEHFWKGNVIAVGNAHAFVEPLESTAIHMMILELDLHTAHFPASRHDVAIKEKLNERIGQRWDALRWFLGVHYRFNRRLDTPFWRAVNADTDISGAEERLALFRERAPLSYRRPLFYPVVPPEFFSDDHSFDTILLGQRVEANFVAPEPETGWSEQVDALHRFARRAMGQREALALLRERPELLAQFVGDRDSWVHHWLPT
jgi:tryptophan halogenase